MNRLRLLFGKGAPMGKIHAPIITFRSIRDADRQFGAHLWSYDIVLTSVVIAPEKIKINQRMDSSPV